MQQCHYCLERKVEDNSLHLRIEPKRKLLFPDGQKLTTYLVCLDCLAIQEEWENGIRREKLAIAEERRRWHVETAQRREEREAIARVAAVIKVTNLRTQMALCQRTIDSILKKYPDLLDKPHET